ncbi:MAG: GntR family transcriptional regulator [Pseudomonadota bacterium]
MADMQDLAVESRSIADRLRDVALDPSKNLVSQVFEILKDMIVAITLKPGELISEKEVAEALGASKTPVREAVIRLEDMGLVEVVPKSGTYVTPIQLDRYIEACFIRLRLETGAVRRAAERQGGFEGIIRLEACIREQEEMLAANERVGFFRLDESFHRQLFEIAGIPGVWNVLNQSKAELDRIRHMKRIHKISRAAEVVLEHKAIAKAVREHDPDAAEEALIKHIGSLDSEIDTLSSHPKILESIDQLNAFEIRRRSRGMSRA